MSSFTFSVQKYPAYGTYGEFSVGSGSSQIRAQYLLTKIRPGQQGHWENQLASQMAPWREIFKIEELSFDELIQRDLDDSRVAHDLIPYLLGETGQHARFFPPILAVLVPKRTDRSGISPRYPAPTTQGETITFGELFDFEKAVVGGQISPLGVIRYNPQQSSIVIVDGQHRAMAILALHRQINKSWGSDPFAPYYSHIQVNPQAVSHIELPVCIVYFPDIHDENLELKQKGVDLISVCREIFIVVNRQAKQVSKSRELLLDDEDFAAFMMRRTLTQFKDRSTDASEVARIYSFAFGDSEADNGSQVMAGQLEICSAVALHKMHAAAGFGLPAAFNLTKTADVTDGRNVRNPIRPVEILAGSEASTFESISRRSAKNHKPEDIELISRKIGNLVDRIMLPLFDNLRPYTSHNQAMRQLLEALNDSTALADPVQAKCRSLLFDGTSNRNVFEEHITRLKDNVTELKIQGQPIPAHLTQQISYCESVSRAMFDHEDAVKLKRCYILFNIDVQNFSNRDKSVVEAEIKEIKQRGKSIFDAISTQAFQLGYLMAVLSHVEIILPTAATYDERIATIDFVSKIYLSGLNTFFAVSAVRHRTLSGYVNEGRARSFEASQSGFRGLLAATNVRELNEKQWEFFRYMIMEIVHSRMASNAVLQVLNNVENATYAARFRTTLPSVTRDIEILRDRLFEAAVRTSQGAPDFRRQVDMLGMQAKADGKNDDEIKLLIDSAILSKRLETIEICKTHLKSSLTRIDTQNQIQKRLSEGSTDFSQLEHEASAIDIANTRSDFDVALASDHIQSNKD